MKRNLKNAPLTTTSSPPPQPLGLHLVLSVPDFGSRFGVKKTTVWKWLSMGMPHLKLSPRKTKIPTAEADRWVKDNFLRQREI